MGNFSEQSWGDSVERHHQGLLPPPEHPPTLSSAGLAEQMRDIKGAGEVLPARLVTARSWLSVLADQLRVVPGTDVALTVVRTIAWELTRTIEQPLSLPEWKRVVLAELRSESLSGRQRPSSTSGEGCRHS